MSEPGLPEKLIALHHALDDAGIPHAVGGAIALGYYAEPRATIDVDINVFVPVAIVHPAWMIAFLVLTATTFCLFGFILGVWARSFEQLNFVPMLIVTPLTFLGGAFYSIDMLPPAWRTFSLVNPVVYLISGFRWSFYGSSDVGVGLSLAMTLGFFAICLAVVTWIFRTGYRLKN